VNRSLLFALTCLLLTPTAHAGSPFITMAIEYGGDTLAEDNALYSSKLKAGGFAYFAAGYRIPLLRPLSLSGSIGFKNDSLIANNGEADFTRFPLELILQANVSQRLSIGGGVSYHVAPDYRDNFPDPLNPSSFNKFIIDFDNALGVVLQANYHIGINGERAEDLEGREVVATLGFDMGLRYTFIDYESPDISKTINGDSLGLFIGLNW